MTTYALCVAGKLFTKACDILPKDAADLFLDPNFQESALSTLLEHERVASNYDPNDIKEQDFRDFLKRVKAIKYLSTGETRDLVIDRFSDKDLKAVAEHLRELFDPERASPKETQSFIERLGNMLLSHETKTVEEIFTVTICFSKNPMGNTAVAICCGKVSVWTEKHKKSKVIEQSLRVTYNIFDLHPSKMQADVDALVKMEKYALDHWIERMSTKQNGQVTLCEPFLTALSNACSVPSNNGISYASSFFELPYDKLPACKEDLFTKLEYRQSALSTLLELARRKSKYVPAAPNINEKKFLKFLKEIYQIPFLIERRRDQLKRHITEVNVDSLVKQLVDLFDSGSSMKQKIKDLISGLAKVLSGSQSQEIDCIFTTTFCFDYFNNGDVMVGIYYANVVCKKNKAGKSTITDQELTVNYALLTLDAVRMSLHAKDLASLEQSDLKHWIDSMTTKPPREVVLCEPFLKALDAAIPPASSYCPIV